MVILPSEIGAAAIGSVSGIISGLVDAYTFTCPWIRGAAFPLNDTVSYIVFLTNNRDIRWCFGTWREQKENSKPVDQVLIHSILSKTLIAKIWITGRLCYYFAIIRQTTEFLILTQIHMEIPILVLERRISGTYFSMSFSANSFETELLKLLQTSAAKALPYPMILSHISSFRPFRSR